MGMMSRQTDDAREHVLLAHFAERTTAEHAQRELHGLDETIDAEIVESQIVPRVVPPPGRPPIHWLVIWMLGALAIGAAAAATIAGLTLAGGGWPGYAGIAIVLAATALALWLLGRMAFARSNDAHAPPAPTSVLRIELHGHDHDVIELLRNAGARRIAGPTPAR